jgi:hypothetical protein
MSKTKPGFSIYSPNTLLFKRMMAKAGDKRFKNAKIPELASIIFQSPVSGNLDKHLLVSEVLWDSEGRKVVFPGDTDFFNSLLKSKFALGGGVSLNLPYSSFILAMPKDYMVDGVTIPSVIVNYNLAHERTQRYNTAATIMGLPLMENAENSLTGNDSLSFFYQDPYGDAGVFVQVNQTPINVGSALSANSADEYAEVLGRIPDDLVSAAALPPSPTDLIIQYVVTKLIAGISVYLSARGIDKLQDGLPYGGRLTISNLKTDIKYSYSHLPLSEVSSKGGATGVMTTRSFHFRQLRAPIYYQNEFKNLQAGSRWVFVKEAQVGNYKAQHIV